MFRVTLIAVFAAITFGRAASAEAEKKQFVCRPQVYEYLVKAQKAYEASQYQDAHAALDRARKRVKLNDHESALAYQTRGYVFAGEDKLEQAAEALEKAAALNALPDGTQLAIRYSLGQIHLAAKHPAKAVVAFDAWMAVADNPSADALYTIAIAKFQAKQYAGAAQYAEWAVKRTKQPKDSWLQLQLAAYFETKQLKKAVPVVEQMIERKPHDRSRWQQLVSLYTQLNDDRRALATAEIAYRAGIFSSRADMVGLAQRLMSEGVPTKAAAVLEEAVAKKHVELDGELAAMIADGWFQAAQIDRAAIATRRAAKLSKNGRLYARLLQVEIDREAYDEAVDAGTKALAKGGLANEGQVHLLIGVAHQRRGRFDKARAAFTRASKFESTKNLAAGWLQYSKESRGPGESRAGP